MTGTTVRLDPDVRAFYEAQAKELGDISLQAMIAMTLRGGMEASIEPETAPVSLMRHRLFALFRAHGIDFPTMAEVLRPFGFHLSTLQDGAAVVDLMTNDLIDFLSERFWLERKWLVGQSNYPTRRAGQIYKRPAAFCAHVAELYRQGLKPRAFFIRSTGADFEAAFEHGDDFPAQEVTVVIERRERTARGTEYRAFEQWDTERWNYHNVRLFLKAAAAFCAGARQRYQFEFWSYTLPERLQDDLAQRRIVVADALNQSVGGGSWHIEDYADFGWDGTKEKAQLPHVREVFERDCASYLEPAFWIPA